MTLQHAALVSFWFQHTILLYFDVLQSGSTCSINCVASGNSQKRNTIDDCPTCTRWRCLSCLRCRFSSSSFLCKRFCISTGATTVLGSNSLFETDKSGSLLLSLSTVLSPSSSSLKLSTTNSESLWNEKLRILTFNIYLKLPPGQETAPVLYKIRVKFFEKDDLKYRNHVPTEYGRNVINTRNICFKNKKF